ncbi:glycosyltransferase family 4 protein [Zoogloea sp.]|uniref:glycosyltransferase family 4 protein n=1 Tax=Zoogloea sp. TaxID=49181 RepID=UPI0035AF90F6
MSSLKAKKVVIVQRRLTHYRVSLFEQLKKSLDENGVELVLLYGKEHSEESQKKDSANISWAKAVYSAYFFGRKACLMNISGGAASCDLLILPQENSLIANYLYIFNPYRKNMIAFWGHGANLQSSNPNGWREKFKKFVLKKVDWWFAYTDHSANIIKWSGFSDRKITVLNNSIDDKQLRADLKTLVGEKKYLRDELGLPEKGHVFLYIGSLYEDKRLDVLIEAVDKIKRTLFDCSLLIVGDGPSKSFILEAIRKRPWIKWVGARYGLEKAKCLCVADFILNPGAVGLNVLDSFVSETPIATFASAKHGPEFAYLVNRKNAIVVESDLDQYVEAILKALSDNKIYAQLLEGCRDRANEITLERMVKRFTFGILSALEQAGISDD